MCVWRCDGYIPWLCRWSGLIVWLSSNSTGTSFPVISLRTCWRRRQLPRNKLATSYEEVGNVARPSWHVEMVWKSSLPRNFLVTSWRLPRNICYREVTGKLVPVEFELYRARASVVMSASDVMSPQQDEATGIVSCLIKLSGSAANHDDCVCWRLTFWRAGELYKGDESATCRQQLAGVMEKPRSAGPTLSCRRLFVECSASALCSLKETPRPSDVGLLSRTCEIA